MENITKKYKWMTMDEVADLLRCSPKSVFRHIIKRKSKGIIWIKQPFGKRSRLLARADTVDKYISSLEYATPRRYRPAFDA